VDLRLTERRRERAEDERKQQAKKNSRFYFQAVFVVLQRPWNGGKPNHN
jgi:hypothetical protein